jgi:SOS-response transcriptional repressor LexA
MLSGPDLGAALIAAMKMKGVGPTAVAEAFGVKPPSVIAWQQTGRIHKKHITTLLTYFADVVSPDHWGLEQNPLPAHFGSSFEPASVGSRSIPVITYAQAGAMAGGVDAPVVGNHVEFLLTDLDLSKNAFSLRLRDDSMQPDFRAGDMVVIDPAATPLPGEFVLANVEGEADPVFRKFRPRGVSTQGSKVFELAPLNEDHATIRSDTATVVIIGTMLEFRRYSRRKS